MSECLFTANGQSGNLEIFGNAGQKTTINLGGSLTSSAPINIGGSLTTSQPISIGGSFNTTGPVSLGGNITLTTPISQIASGSLAISVAAVSGCSGISFVAPSLIEAISTSVGNIVTIKASVTFTASANFALFNIGVPSSLTNVFANGSQAWGLADVTSGTGPSNLSAVASVASSRNVEFTLLLGGTSGTYTANITASFVIN